MKNKELLDKIVAMDIEAKSHMSSLDDDVVGKIKTALFGKQVDMVEENEGVTVSLSDLNLYGFGKTETSALNALKGQVVDLYEQLNSEEKLGPLPRQWKMTLYEIIEHL